MANKVKGKKMDTYFISNQAWELSYVDKKFKVKPGTTKGVKKILKTTSRQKVYNYIRNHT